MASWKCDICGVIMDPSSKSKHLLSAKHTSRVNGNDKSICEICKVTVTKSHIARHKVSHTHISALALTEEIRQQNIQYQRTMAESNITISVHTPEIKVSLDTFIVDECARYVKWIRDNPKHMTTYQNHRSVIYIVINNMYAAVACKDFTCPWWPKDFKLPDDAMNWRDALLHRLIGDVAMAESVLIVERSGLMFVSK